MTLPGISKHLKVLERCGLITRRRQAQFRPCHLESKPLDAAVEWIEVNRRLWCERFDKLDDHLRTLQAPPTGDTHGEPADVLHFSRVFDAPRQLVFSCMVEPEHLTHFWGPIGVSAPLDQITVDARPGGAFTTVMVNDADGSTYPTRARYLEVVAPERLSWIEDQSGMTVTATFTDLGDDRTQVEIHQTNVPAEMLTPQRSAAS